MITELPTASPVWKYLPMDSWTWVFKPWVWIRLFRYSWQRLTKGFCDGDTWGIDDYLDYVLPEVCNVDLQFDGLGQNIDDFLRLWNESIVTRMDLSQEWFDDEKMDSDLFKARWDEAIHLRRKALVTLNEMYNKLWW